jgi:transcriptional regulator with XRE-family HTH domain
MPRPNRGRTLASEANVAERVAYERETRGLSYEALAKRMTEAGCRIASSALFRIEKGNPARHITVDELVAFAKVFGTTEDDLLTSMDLIRRKRALALVSRTHQALDELPKAVFLLSEIVAESSELSRTDSELSEFYTNQSLAELDKPKAVPLAKPVSDALTALVTTVIETSRIPEVAAEIRGARAAWKLT